MRPSCLALLVLAPLVLFTACGGPDGDAPSGAGTPSPASGSPSFLLDADLDDAVGVLDTTEAEESAEVIVFGRVRATADGVFTIVDDDHVKYCGQDEGCMDDCKTPWDYCCENPDDVKRATIVVEAFDEDGKAIPKAELGIRPLDLVALRGVLSRDEGGAVVVRASSGWHRRERPVVELDVEFP